ncbi:RagB/SusD family nutrient uptake outer membrane protein [Sphingobacterium sp. HMA12]|uniref:RagB/SusD family nutrient uptake outer membrane protein n=1 Tax=Sphingobacterium sp. HMA12 TaxID=2050894 RepID=UPI0018F7F3C0|nr:RagB/SusD family nutrient uptake outer membrane protein [Sphingobacterium sp. HMA12]
MILSFVTAGCDKDLLDAIPTDRLSENIFWKSQTDAELAVNALYNDLDGAEIFYLDALTDIAHVNQPFAVDAYIEQGTYDASSSRVYNTWNSAYKGIGAANYFLANVNRIEGSKNEALIARYIGEARVLRAYQYIKLAYLFGKVPLVKTPLTLQEGREVRQAELTEIYDFIDEELEQAAASLPNIYTGNDMGRITRWTALGLKARAALYAGRFAVAANAAKLIIDSHQFELYPSYATLFSYSAENNKEVLLDKQFLENIYTQNVFTQLAPYSQQNGQSTYVPTKALIDSYTTASGHLITDATSGYDLKNPYKNRDHRLYYSIFLDGDQLPNGAIFRPAPNSGTADAVGSTYIASTTGFNIKKYIDKKDFSNPSKSGLNIILLRYAEVLLTFAEAKIEIGQIDESVYAAINQVRNTRDDVKLPNVNTIGDKDQLRQLVRRERTVELAFEGLHLADIRRWKTAEKVVPGKVYGITYLNNKGETVIVEAASERRVFDPQKHYLWPIPQREMNLNSNLRQNPNW